MPDSQKEIEQRVLLPREEVDAWLGKLRAQYQETKSQVFKTFLIGTMGDYVRVRFMEADDHFTLTRKVGTGTVRTEENSDHKFEEKNQIVAEAIAGYDNFVELLSKRYVFQSPEGLEISLTDHDKIGLLLEVERSLEGESSTEDIDSATHEVEAELSTLGLEAMDNIGYKKLWTDLFANHSESIGELLDRIKMFVL